MLPTLWEQFGDAPFLFQHDCALVHERVSSSSSSSSSSIFKSCIEIYTKKLLHRDASIIGLESNHWPQNQNWIKSWGAKTFPPLVFLIVFPGYEGIKWVCHAAARLHACLSQNTDLLYRPHMLGKSFWQLHWACVGGNQQDLQPHTCKHRCTQCQSLTEPGSGFAVGWNVFCVYKECAEMFGNYQFQINSLVNTGEHV